jgi:hypothetical protein
MANWAYFLMKRVKCKTQVESSVVLRNWDSVLLVAETTIYAHDSLRLEQLRF